VIIKGVTDPEKSIREAMHRKEENKFCEIPTNIILSSKCLFDIDSQELSMQYKQWWISV